MSTAETTMFRMASKLPDGLVIGARGPWGVYAHDDALNRWFRQAVDEPVVFGLVAQPHIGSGACLARLPAALLNLEDRAFDAQFPARGHRIPRVERQIEKNLLDSVPVRANKSPGGAESRCQRNQLPLAMRDHRLDFADHVIDV